MESVMIDKHVHTSKQSPRESTGEVDFNNYLMIQTNLPNVITASQSPQQFLS